MTFSYGDPIVLMCHRGLKAELHGATSYPYGNGYYGYGNENDGYRNG